MPFIHLISTKTKAGLSSWLLGSVIASVAIGCLSLPFFTTQGSQAAERTEVRQNDSEEPIQPIEPILNLNAEKVELGKKLFFDVRVSRNSKISCASCHNLNAGGADGRAYSLGVNGSVGAINAPTVLNSGLNFSQFWDGRADTLERQVDDPIQAKAEMGSAWPDVIAKLKASSEYVLAFKNIYRDEVQRENVKNALAEFERSLTTPNSRFDRYLRYESDALSDKEQEGYRLFKSFGCSSCHQGVNAGGNMYQKVGVMAPYFTERGNISRADRGRFNVTNDPRDMYMFKVPSLRNIALTAPYFHDGSAATLEDAVTKMAKYQLGHPLTNSERNLIVSFLQTLTGELNGRAL